MIKTKVRVPYYTADSSRKVLEKLIKEKNYPAVVTGGFTYDEERYSTLEIEHKSNFERIRRWEEIEKEFYKRDYERMRDDYRMLYSLKRLCMSVDSLADLMIAHGNSADGGTLKFYTDEVINEHKQLSKEREEWKAWENRFKIGAP